ncbi:DUF4091 domain-containing protein [candidate division KSB1 bacterium]|nr:DUF4091 domain-containing protein [candidate division KSB1 bacterium]
MTRIQMGMLGALFLPALAFECVFAQMETYTHKLSQSTSALTLWTTCPSERVFKNATPPAQVDDRIRVYAAKNEFEPFILVARPAVSGPVTVSIGDFGNGISFELYQVKTVPITQTSDNLGQLGDYPDPLWPIENGQSLSLVANENTVWWISLEIPSSAPAGDYQTTVTVGGIAVPVHLHVFDFALPEEVQVKSQMNFSFQNILSKYSVPGTGAEYWIIVDKVKQFFIDRRLTPKSALWPGGLTSGGGAPFIDYDCAGALSDPHGIWGFEHPADKYLNGNGFNNGTGFPSFMAATFQNNDASVDQRPSAFCSVTRQASDWYTGDNPSSAYNQSWFAYINALQGYLQNLGYLDKAYYYFANEPQDQADYDAVAWYSKQLKAAAPNFKLMVSEEPKSEIYSQPGAKIDIWLPVLHNFDPAESNDRFLNHDEETWIYFLRSTRPPYFNPITLDHPGIEAKFTGWFLWKYRLRGIAYYTLNNWSQNPWTDPLYDGHNGELFMVYPPSEDNLPIAYGSNNHRLVPSIRIELLRDGLEDYEYLYLLANSQQPIPGLVNDADPQADKIISSLTGYTRDSEFLYNLRRLIGQKLGGEISTIPDIEPPSAHPRAQGDPGDYYINFQDPSGDPVADPLIVNGNTYTKIGWNLYDDDLGYGWYGDMAHVMYRYLTSGPNELQKSIIYDDWGRTKTFEFDLPNGDYTVTVSVGWQGRTYSRNKIVIEGVTLIDDEPSSPYLVRSADVTIADHKLTMNMGIFDEYTMLNYLDIEAIVPTVYCRLNLFLEGCYDGNGTMRADLRTLGYLPLESPFDAEPGQASSLAADIVDWVAVELRNEPFGAPVTRRSALLRSDGAILDVDGVTRDLAFSRVQPGNYFVVVLSRNHLPALSAIPVALQDAPAAVWDFTSNSAAFYRACAVSPQTGVFAAVAGDCSQDGQINSSDYTLLYNQRRSPSGYDAGDLNLDGSIDSADDDLWRLRARQGRDLLP